MIRIKYECDETDQKMSIELKIPENRKYQCNVVVSFAPGRKEAMEDPLGLAAKIFDIAMEAT